MPATIRRFDALALIALGLTASAGPTSAQTGPAARVNALLRSQTTLTGFDIPPLSSVPTPAAPAAAPAAPDVSVVPAGLWTTSAAPDPATLSWLASRLPGVDAAAIRVLSPDAADAIFAAAVSRGLTPLDLFTDPAFRENGIFFLPAATSAALFARYEMRVLTPASGTDSDGRPFTLQALVVGRGRIDALYDHGDFGYDNPFFTDGRYTLSDHVIERIQGPADLTIEGVSIKVGFFKPTIKRIVKTSPGEARVETNYGNRTKPVYPIVRLPPQK